MDYILTNKEAWEEAFDKRSEGWGEDIPDRIKSGIFPFFEKEMVDVLKRYDLKDKTVAQFCSNNGRELLSLVKNSRAKEGFGFDIAENQTELEYYMIKYNYDSKTFTSYTHPFSEIINAICLSGLRIIAMDEFDYDISDMFEHLDHKEVPLSFILEVIKNK